MYIVSKLYSHRIKRVVRQVTNNEIRLLFDFLLRSLLQHHRAW